MKNCIKYHHFSQYINLAKLAHLCFYSCYFPLVRWIPYRGNLFRSFLSVFLSHFINDDQQLNCSASKSFFFSPVPLTTNWSGTTAESKISKAESAHRDSDKSQLRANFQRIVIDVAKAAIMIRVLQIFFINSITMLREGSILLQKRSLKSAGLCLCLDLLSSFVPVTWGAFKDYQWKKIQPLT